MNRNQKIGVGCGAAGCLGLIVLCIGLGAFMYWRSQRRVDVVDYRERPSDSSSNSNSTSNSNSNVNSGSSNSSDSGNTSSFSNDDRHKLFQAAGMTKDQELNLKVMKKIGLFKADNTPADDFPQFIKEHFAWAMQNTDFVNSVNTPATARAYIDEQLPGL